MTSITNDPFAILDDAVAKQAAEELAAKRFASARDQLILRRDARSAFFATLALRLKLEVDWSCQTMQTDGHLLSYHPEFVAGLSPDELLGVLVHEVMHNALAHPFRRGSRSLEQWNIACDLAVNPILLEAGFVLPVNRLMPGEGSYTHLPTGKSADEYYGLMASHDPDAPGTALGGGSGSGQGTDAQEPSQAPADPGGCGGVRDPASASQTESDTLDAQWQVAVAQAEQTSKRRGELPAGIRRMVENIQHPALSWRELLQSFISATARNDYSWSRPNRRFLWQGLYLPGLHSEELGDVVIAIDHSGSVSARELALFSQEVNGILSAFDCTASVLYHDTKVQRVQSWRSSDGPLTLDPVGGGGTSHRCVFEWLEQQDLTPACVVCLTDLETRFPDRTPKLPVLWAVTGTSISQPPFGTRITITS